MRKHQRLLTVKVSPLSFSVFGWGLGDKFTSLATGFVDTGNGKTALGLLSKDVRDVNVKYKTHVTVQETEFMDRKQVIPALNEFANLAGSIIKKFDF